MDVTEVCIVVPDIIVYGVQPVWDRGICTDGSSGSFQVPGKKPGPILQWTDGNYPEHQ